MSIIRLLKVAIPSCAWAVAPLTRLPPVGPVVILNVIVELSVVTTWPLASRTSTVNWVAAVPAVVLVGKDSNCSDVGVPALAEMVKLFEDALGRLSAASTARIVYVPAAVIVRLSKVAMPLLALTCVVEPVVKLPGPLRVNWMAELSEFSTLPY